MKIELTDREVDRLTKILNERYSGSLNLLISKESLKRWTLR